MNEAERKAMRKMNQFLGRWAFDNQPRRRKALYWEAPDQRRFYHTPWKDEDGNYWTWVAKPVGKGAISGKATGWNRVGPMVRSRKRKTAKARARKRYGNWMKYKFGGE